MVERTGLVTLMGNPVTLVGPGLREGDLAPDFTVLDGDPVTEPADRVGNMPVLATWVDGEPG